MNNDPSIPQSPDEHPILGRIWDYGSILDLSPDSSNALSSMPLASPHVEDRDLRGVFYDLGEQYPLIEGTSHNDGIADILSSDVRVPMPDASLPVVAEGSWKPTSRMFDDPVREELYLQIKQESWFLNQTLERVLTPAEADRIPCSIPGKSVLLAFFNQNLVCAACGKRFERSDRAEAHIRSHFQIRPFACRGICGRIPCYRRFTTASNLNSHLTNRRVPCASCQKPQLRQNMARHRRNCQGRKDDFRNVTPSQIAESRHGGRVDGTGPASVLSDDQSENQETTPVSSDADQSQNESPPQQSPQSLFAILDSSETASKAPPEVQSGGRIVRLVIYRKALLEEVHRVWIHRQARFGDIAESLSDIYQMGATGRFVVLEADWGPMPRWKEADFSSSIGDSSQVLYVVFKTQSTQHVLGVVRDSQDDFPIWISISHGSSMAMSESIVTSYPNLVGRIKSITGYASDEDVGHYQFDHNSADSSSKLRTSVIITLDKSTEIFTTELPYTPIPALLQVPFLYCEHLMQRAYALKLFALQMIHLSSAIRHLLLILANEMKPVFADRPSGVEAVLAAGNDVSDLLQLAPLLSHKLKLILDRIDWVMDHLAEEGSSSLEETQKNIDAIFTSLCGEFPGAATVRHSYKRFKRLRSIDHQEKRILDGEGTSSPEMTQATPRNEHSTSGSLYNQDADHEMVDSEAVSRSPARRLRAPHMPIGDNDEYTMDLDGYQWESD